MSFGKSVFDLNNRVWELKKNHADVIRAINEAQFTYRDSVLVVDTALYSRAKNGLDKSPKALAVLEKANEIVNKWEKEQKGVTNNG